MQDPAIQPFSLIKRFSLIVFAACLLLWPMHSLFGGSGVFVNQFSRALPRQSAIECLLVLGIVYCGLRASSRRGGAAVLLVTAELYARRQGVDISIALMAAYSLGIYTVGANAGHWLYPQSDADSGYALRTAFLGVLTWSLVIWLSSLAGWGSISQIRWLTMVFLGGNFLAWAIRSRQLVRQLPSVAMFPYSRTQASIYAVVVTTVLVMFTKAAVSVDFDSLWYGITADRTMLAAGNLYAGEGLVAHVHYYPKLFESLQIPFLASGSLSLIMGTSILSWLLLMATVHQILGEFDLSADIRLLGGLLAATIPAVCDSALTSKGELFAAWLCLFAVYGAFRYSRDCTRYDWLALAGASALLAPMSRLSVLPYAVLIFVYAVTLAVWPGRRLPLNNVAVADIPEARPPRWTTPIPVLMSLVLIALVCLRTYWLTGMALTTPDVLIDLQSRLGLHLHDAIGEYRPSYRVPFPEGLYSYLLDPSRYIHVALFWTGNVWLYLMISACLANGQRWMVDNRVAVLLITGLCFFAVLFGYRSTEDGADGNYFIVPVTCLLMAGVIGLFAPNSPRREAIQRLAWLVSPAFIGFGLMVLLSAANWRAGTRRPDAQFDRLPFSEIPSMANSALANAGLRAVADKLHDLPVNTRVVGDIGEDLGAFLPLRYESLRTIAWERAKLLRSPDALAAWLAQARIGIVIIHSPAGSDPVDQLLVTTITMLAGEGAATRLELTTGNYAVWQLNNHGIMNGH